MLGSAPNVKSCENQELQSPVLKESSRHWTLTEMMDYKEELKEVL